MPHSAQPWDPSGRPDLTGRVALVTGANSGTGFEAAQVLAGRGATVFLGCRDAAKGQAARDRILQAHPGARVEFLALDLGALASIQAAAEAFGARSERLDLLLNNAGVMIPPAATTADGFELQFGTNHLGHFALTGRLLPRLLATEGARVVTMSSAAHRIGRIRFDDLQFQRGYHAWAAYGQSKLANLLFTFELQRRLTRAGAATLALAAHPGWARTGLQRHARGSWLLGSHTRPIEALLSQDAAGGALPLLRAALDPAVRGGEYFGPGGFLEFKGPAVPVGSSARSRDPEVQQELWRVSERLTKLTFPL